MNNTIKIQKCSLCGGPKPNKKTLTCSITCSLKVKRNRTPRPFPPCEVCGIPKHTKDKRVKTCKNPSCRSAYRSKTNKERYDGIKLADQIYKCSICSSSFTPKSKNQKTCSKPCTSKLKSISKKDQYESNPMSKDTIEKIKKAKLESGNGNKGVKRSWKASKSKLYNTEFKRVPIEKLRGWLKLAVKKIKPQALYRVLMTKHPNAVLNINDVFIGREEILSGDKFTEKVWRIIEGDYAKKICVSCGKRMVPFYTIKKAFPEVGVCNVCGRGNFSKSSQDLFFSILKNLPEEYKKDVRFGRLNGEKRFWFNKKEQKLMGGKKYTCFDFVYKKKVIEFDGEFWHKDTKKIDNMRDRVLADRGYSTLRIRECDYIENPEKQIKKCVDFLTIGYGAL